MVVYAAVMTAVFLISFGLLLAVLLIGGGNSQSGGILRPGITETEDEDQAIAAVEQAKHSVVVIEVRTENGGGTGTGIIMTADGYIATNHHVIEDATQIKVTFYDGSVLSAELVGSSEMDDLAVIKVDGFGLPAATFAHSDDCYVGQTVYAIGTPAGADFGWTTTKGIISYKDREVKIYNDDDGTLEKKLRLLQTDAMVNPGNSGGPLVNARGEVVGVVSMKLADGYEGIGFAIPIADVMNMTEDLITNGYRTNMAYLGVVVMDLDSNTAAMYSLPMGSYVRSVEPGSCAEKAGIQPKDIIIAVGEYSVEGNSTLQSALRKFRAGDSTTVTVYRAGAELELPITFDERPQDPNASLEQQPPQESGEMPSSGSFEDWYNYFAPFFDNGRP